MSEEKRKIIIIYYIESISWGKAESKTNLKYFSSGTDYKVMSDLEVGT